MPILELPVTCPGIDSQILVTKGDTKSFVFPAGVDLTGVTSVKFFLKRSNQAFDTLLEKTLTITPPLETATLTLNFGPSDFTDIPAGFYFFRIAKFIGVSNEETLVTGEFILQPFDQSFVGRIDPIMTLGLTRTPERIGIEFRDRNGVLGNPEEVNVKLLDFRDQVLVSYALGNPALINPEGGIFYFDFLSLRSGDALVIWQYRFAGEEPNTIVRNLRFVDPVVFHLIGEVRLYIDKARKASNKTIAFNPADVAEYVENSLRDFNVTSPSTDIRLELFNGSLRIYKGIIIMGAVIQACIAQGLLAVDQDFQYNDNGISLSIDHSAKLQSWYNVLLQQYVAQKKQAKINFFVPTVLVKTIVGQAFSLGLAKVPASTLARFRGWI